MFPGNQTHFEDTTLQIHLSHSLVYSNDMNCAQFLKRTRCPSLLGVSQLAGAPVAPAQTLRGGLSSFFQTDGFLVLKTIGLYIGSAEC